MSSIGSAAERGVAYPLRTPWRRVALFRSGGALVAAMLVWHGSNFAFNSVAARLLGPDGYGQLASTVALLYVASPLLLAVQTTSSRAATGLAVAGREAEIRGMLSAAVRRLALAGLVAVALLCGSSGVSARFLHIGSGTALSLVAAGIGLSLVTHCQRGVLQGTLEYTRLAISTTVEAVVKVAGAAVILAAVTRNVDGAAAAIPLAAAAAFGANRRLLRRLPGSRETSRQTPGATSGAFTTVGAFVLLALLLSADVLVARRYLSPSEAGLYAAVSLCGKTTFFATSAISLYAFPQFAAGYERGEDTRRLLAAATILVAALTGLMAALYFAKPEVVLDPLFGHRYLGAAPYLGWIALAFGGYSVLYLAGNYLLARRSGRGVVVLLVATAAQVALLATRHGSVGDIVRVQLLVLPPAAAAMLAAALLQRRRPADVVDRAHTAAERDIVRAVREAIGDVPIVLCGSRATGDATETSDYDVVVLLPSPLVAFRLGRLRRVGTTLSRELGLPVAVNPLPRRRLRGRQNLFVWKLVREGRVLSASAGFCLPEPGPLPADETARFSYLATALFHLLAAHEAASDERARLLRKTLLVLAQLRSMVDGRYATRLDEALRRAADPRLSELADDIAAPATWIRLRRSIVAEVEQLGAAHATRHAPAANLRYAALSALRRRARLSTALAGWPIDRRLARVAIALAESVQADGRVDSLALADARRQLPRGLRRHAGETWSSLHLLLAAEWPCAHPLAAQ